MVHTGNRKAFEANIAQSKMSASELLLQQNNKIIKAQLLIVVA